MTPARPTLDWPKGYLLQVYAAAIEHGMVFVEPISQADALSFRQRFYRIRRRSDKSTAAFILPEYHLVTVGEWQSAEGGRLPIIYSSLPDGQALPSIRPASGEEITAVLQPPALAPSAQAPLLDPASIIDLEALDTPMDPDEIESFVERMSRKAKGD